jgi:hypothetical protein
MSEQPEQEAPADPVANEDELYISMAGECKGFRRAGASVLEAAALTVAWRIYMSNDRPG